METNNNIEQNKWQNDSNNWKWGMFYYNKKDSRVILPKKNPLWGFTLNFAKGYSYLILLLILICVIALASVNS